MLTIMITITQSLKQGCCHPSEQIRPKIDNEAARAWDPPPLPWRAVGELLGGGARVGPIIGFHVAQILHRKSETEF